MFLATVADGEAAAPGEQGRKTSKTQPESAFGWVLIGWVFGRSLTQARINACRILEEFLIYLYSY